MIDGQHIQCTQRTKVYGMEMESIWNIYGSIRKIYVTGLNVGNVFVLYLAERETSEAYQNGEFEMLPNGHQDSYSTEQLP